MNKITLRAAQHPDQLRIVMEGPESLLGRAIVNQKEQNIQVTFPGDIFALQEEKVAVAYKKVSKDTIVFFPLEFKGFKVFQLKHPGRLVIDVFLKTDGPRMQPELGIGERPPDIKISGLKAVVLDAGHGGYEYGIVKDDRIEKNIALAIAKKLGARINTASTRCFLTRTSDRYLGPSERVQFVNSKNAEVFLSIHVGKDDRIVLYVPVIADPVPEEIKPYLVNTGQNYTDETFMLMQSVQKSIVSDFGDKMVSIVHLPYSYLARVEAASLMVELPSFDNASYDEEMTDRLVHTLYKGIYLYEEKTAGWN